MTQDVIQQPLDSLRFRDAKHSYASTIIAGCIRRWATSVQCSSSSAGSPTRKSGPNDGVGYGMRIRGARSLCDAFKLKRTRDIFLNVCAGRTTGGSAPFFVMSTPTLSTLSEVEAHRYEAMGTHRIDKVLTVQLVPVEQILRWYFPDHPPTVVSIDVEGLDLEIVQTVDFKKARPSIRCVESLSYSDSRQEIKDENITSLMTSYGYFLHADTYINSIYVDRERWRQSANA